MPFAIDSSIDWLNMDGAKFEEFVSTLFTKMEYTNVVNRPYVGDGGIDIEMVEQGKLSSSRIGVECKHWHGKTVGREVIQKLDSAIKYEGFTKGIVITTGKFSKEAKKYAERVNIFLIDFQQLEKLVKAYI